MKSFAKIAPISRRKEAFACAKATDLNMRFENMRIDKIRTIVYYKPDSVSWSAKNRRDHIIGVNLTGYTQHDLGYKHLDLEPDYIYFFNQKDDYKAFVDKAGCCYSIHFTTYEEIETESFCKKISNTEEILNRIKKIESEWICHNGRELSMLSDFYGLCNTFYNIINAPYTKRDRRIIEAKEYIDLHFKEKDCLSKAVEISKVSRRRFNDIFKLSFNSTPNSYIISSKTDYAKELLALGYLSIFDVSEMSGFSDVYYFSKMFKKEVGVTPGAYKRSHRP